MAEKGVLPEEAIRCEISVGVSIKAREREALEHASGDESQDKDEDVKEDDGTEEDKTLPYLITCEKDDESNDESKDLTETVALDKAKEANDGGGFETFTTTRVERVVRPNTKYGM
eukprot:13938327-Ditylum_brightwellii.AAC.1